MTDMRGERRRSDLTSREREVLGLVRIGLTNEEIAQRLGISPDTAKFHVSQILAKLGVATREGGGRVHRASAALTLAATRRVGAGRYGPHRAGRRRTAGVEGGRERCGQRRASGVRAGDYDDDHA